MPYPGACAREFRALMSIVVHDLLGWKGNKQVQNGIFGKMLAWTMTVEEQAGKCLHGHLLLWILEFYMLQQQLFLSNATICQAAIDELQKYIIQILSTSFDISANWQTTSFTF